MNEITHALLGSTLTPVAVLLPLGLLSGVPGAFFRPAGGDHVGGLAGVAGAGPELHAGVGGDARVARDAARERRAGRSDGGVARALLRARLAVDAGARAGWRCSIGIGFVLLAAVAYRHVDTGFVPEMDEGAFVLDYWSPPGTSLPETLRLLQQVDAILQQTPEVASFARRTGAELGFFLTETNRGDYSVRLHAQRAARHRGDHGRRPRRDSRARCPGCASSSCRSCRT